MTPSGAQLARVFIATHPDHDLAALEMVDLSYSFHRQTCAGERTCIGCGCTDLHACPDGCSWMRPDIDLCSACFDDGLRIPGMEDDAAYIERGFACAGYMDCTNRVDQEDGVCGDCQDREPQGGCPGCGGSCLRACR